MLWLMIGLVVLMVAQQWYLRGAFFGRKVPRMPCGYKDFLVPVDSYVVYCKELEPGPIYGSKKGDGHYIGDVGSPSVLIGFYMTVLDRHFAVAPCDVTLVDIERWDAGVNLPMLDLLEYTRVMWLHKFDRWMEKHLDGWLTQNERVVLTFETGHGWQFKMVLIGDKYVNKIDVFGSVGDKMLGGTTVAYIHRGSQVDLLVPRNRLHLKQHNNVNKGFRAGDSSLMGEK